MKVYLATDHAGFAAKEALKKELVRSGFEVVDYGAHALRKNDDYPDFIRKAARALSRHPEDVAFLFGGSGQGEAMAANRFKKVRAAVFYGGPEEIVILSREHNDANALAFGARFISVRVMVKVAMVWLDTKFSKDVRHARRIKKIDHAS